MAGLDIDGLVATGWRRHAHRPCPSGALSNQITVAAVRLAAIATAAGDNGGVGGGSTEESGAKPATAGDGCPTCPAAITGWSLLTQYRTGRAVERLSHVDARFVPAPTVNWRMLDGVYSPSGVTTLTVTVGVGRPGVGHDQVRAVLTRRGSPRPRA